MVKDYVKREVKDEDLRILQQLLRARNPIIASPSNIKDIYDFERYRKENLSTDINLNAFIDNNILTQILPLIDGRKAVGVDLSDSERLSCAIMCFLIYSGIEANPTTALFERPIDPNYPTKEKEDYLFRVADHVPPQVYADLALGKYSDIPNSVKSSSFVAVDSNDLTQKNIAETSYQKLPEKRWSIIYMNLIKAWLIYREDLTPDQRFEKYLDWYFEHSVSEYACFTFVAIFLSDKRFPKMIKQQNSMNADKIFQNIKNVTWDIFSLSTLIEIHNKTNEDFIWFFCTRDELLTKLYPEIYRQSDLESCKLFAQEYYSLITINYLHRYSMKINTRTQNERTAHINILASISHSSIKNLEDSVYNLLS